MRSTVHIVVVTLALLTGLVNAGTWEDEFPVTQDPVSQFVSLLAVAPDDAVHVLWPDWTDFEDTKVTLTTSRDRGDTWSDPAVLFEGAAYDGFDLLADGGGLHLILLQFMEDEEEFKHPYYTRSIDGGATFSEPVRIGDRDNVEAIRFTACPCRMFLYAKNYVDDIDFNYLYVSGDGGVTWQEKPLLPGTPVHHPEFVVRDTVLHMVFAGGLGSPEIRYARSFDFGTTWSVPVAVSAGTGPHAQLPHLAIDEAGAIHVVWEDDRNDHFNVMYTRSEDSGMTWSADEQLNDTSYGARARIIADEEGLQVVWCQYHGDDGWPSSWGSFDYGIVWHRSSHDSGVTWSDEFRVSQNESIPPTELPDNGANVVKLAAYSTGFCTLWQDKRDGNIDLYMRNSAVSTCVADIDGSGDVGFTDLVAVLAQWGPCSGCPEDLDGSGDVGFTDLVTVLADWGSCGD